MGLSIQKVTEITGLDRGRIYQAAELAQLGAPAHFTYVSSSIVYTPAGLNQLVDSLQKLGETGAAKTLAPEITKLRGVVGVGSQDMPAGPTPSPAAPAPLHWMARHEADQEEAAA